MLRDHLIEFLILLERKPWLKKMGIGPIVLCGDSVRIWPLYPKLKRSLSSVSQWFPKCGWVDQCLSEPPGCMFKMQFKIYRHGAQESTLQAGFVDASYKTIAQNWIKIFQPLLSLFLVLFPSSNHHSCLRYWFKLLRILPWFLNTYK